MPWSRTANPIDDIGVSERVLVCCREDVVAGKLRGFPVAGKPWPVIVVFVEGSLIAFPGYCPHDRVSLVEHGQIDRGVLTCRGHGYQFDLQSGACELAPWLRLTRFPVTVVSGDVWVELPS
jgi:nitrite reductase/ring-hydroxylating ferredoxin subunit